MVLEVLERFNTWLFGSDVLKLDKFLLQNNKNQPVRELQVPSEKPAKLSRFTTTNIVLPSHADSRGLIYGGVVLGWIDLAAGMSAKRHAVGVRVETEHPITGKRKYCCQAYLTFVALSRGNSIIPVTKRSENSPVTVPRIVPNTVIETHRYELAEQRRQARISQSKNAKIERAKLTKVREVMREWAEYMNMETKSSAEIPPLLQEPDAYEERNDNLDNDPAKLYLHRRRSTLQGILPTQPDEKLMSESFAEIADLILPQHANSLQV
ncbi:20717_t:CDS:2 [Racocetra persica]|uniref:20717_t:CDS:1 n=1 Tax=Racocetra persica TaxID=160502 RepID=A0ACA9MS08_9GLOM|nr:20717_t:CDS:2 [Racocetra persica]